MARRTRRSPGPRNAVSGKVTSVPTIRSQFPLKLRSISHLAPSSIVAHDFRPCAHNLRMSPEQPLASPLRNQMRRSEQSTIRKSFIFLHLHTMQCTVSDRKFDITPLLSVTSSRNRYPPPPSPLPCGKPTSSMKTKDLEPWEGLKHRPKVAKNSHFSAKNSHFGPDFGVFQPDFSSCFPRKKCPGSRFYSAPSLISIIESPTAYVSAG
jgi:hypothetical protein